MEPALKAPKDFPGMKRSGILLYGPPGCGKTVLVHSLVRKCGCSLLDVRTEELMSKWQGNTEKLVIPLCRGYGLTACLPVKRAISTLLSKAKAIAPCIVFIDEIDSPLKQRGEKQL